MKRTLSFFITCLALSVPAQTVQKGIVKEYNEKDKKTPLSGVELRVRNAGSTVTDKNGGFILKFAVGKPGERIDIRSIEKKGYEIFNKEAIAQWNLNPDRTFEIVMCRSDKFKKIRDGYLKVSSESYAKKLKKEEEQLAKLKKDGKLKQAEYDRELATIQELYENQLDNIESYVDRFARIDLSELSQVEQEIIELVQQGKIEEAISRYDDLRIEEQLIEGLHNLQKVDAAISDLSVKETEITLSMDSLSAMAVRQVENLMADLTPENIARARLVYGKLTEALGEYHPIVISIRQKFESNNADGTSNHNVDLPDHSVAGGGPDRPEGNGAGI